MATMEDDLNTQAYYLRHFVGLTFKEIGEKIGYSTSGVEKLVNQKLFARMPSVNVYQYQIRYCQTECDTSGMCRTCHLFKFMLKFMIKKRVR
jgi:hypothetical protein